MLSDPSSVDGAIDHSLNPVSPNENPVDGATGVGLNPVFSISVAIEDPDGDDLNWTIEMSPDVGQQDNSSASGGNGTKTCDIPSLAYGTVYNWYVNVPDGTHWTNKTFWFEAE